MNALLILEPGFKEYKETIVKTFDDIPLVFIIGLKAITDYSWLMNYSSFILEVDYNNFNVIEIEKYLNKKKISLIGAINFIDPTFPYLIKIQQHFNLPITSKELNLNSKKFVRDLLRKNNGNYNPNYSNMIKDSLTFPLILKPDNMMGSLGISKINSHEELKLKINITKNIDFEDENLRMFFPKLTPEVIIEDFIPGAEYSAECLISKGESIILATFLKELKNFEEIGDKEIDEPLIYLYIDDIVKKLNLVNALIHIEYKIIKNKIKIIEINCRIGGDYIPKLLKLKGYNIKNLIYKAYTNKKVEVTKILNQKFEAKYFSAKEDIFFLGSEKSKKNYEVNLLREENSFIKKDERILEVIGKNIPNDFKIKSLMSIGQNEHINVFEGIPDIQTIYNLETRSWNKQNSCSIKELKDRIHEGRYYSIYDNVLNKFVGFIFGKYINYKENDTWYNIKNKKESTKDKNCFYIISMSILPNQKRKYATKTFQTISKYFNNQNITVKYGMRIPNYHKFHKNHSINQYIKLIQSGKIKEYGLKASFNAGGKIERIIENYYNDLESFNDGVIFYHE